MCVNTRSEIPLTSMIKKALSIFEKVRKIDNIDIVYSSSYNDIVHNMLMASAFANAYYEYKELVEARIVCCILHNVKQFKRHKFYKELISKEFTDEIEDAIILLNENDINKIRNNEIAFEVKLVDIYYQNKECKLSNDSNYIIDKNFHTFMKLVNCKNWEYTTISTEYLEEIESELTNIYSEYKINKTIKEDLYDEILHIITKYHNSYKRGLIEEKVFNEYKRFFSGIYIDNPIITVEDYIASREILGIAVNRIIKKDKEIQEKIKETTKYIYDKKVQDIIKYIYYFNDKDIIAEVENAVRLYETNINNFKNFKQLEDFIESVYDKCVSKYYDLTSKYLNI